MDLIAEGIGFWDWELIEGRLTISPEWMNLMGYDRSDLPTRSIDHDNLPEVIKAWSQYVHPEDRAQAEVNLTNYLLFRRSQIYNNEFRFRKKDGSYIRIFSNGYAQWNKKGKLARFRVNHVDISQLGSFDKAVLAQFQYMNDAGQATISNLTRRLRLQKAVLISTIIAFSFSLLWVLGLMEALWENILVYRTNTLNPAQSSSSNALDDIADFPAFNRNREEIQKILKSHLGIHADRTVFGYYEPGGTPLRGRIAAQAKRQSVSISVTEEPWFIEDPILIERRDAHLRGEQYLINNPFVGLYDAGFQISAPGFWVRPDGPAIAWFVGIECEPKRQCDEDNFDIKALKNDIEDVLNSTQP